MQNNITHKIYHNDGNPAVLDQIKGDQLMILDVGCGAGDNARVLQSKGHVVDGITHSDEEAELGQPFMRKVYVMDIGNGLSTDINGQYDYAICSHVLEHIAYPEQLLLDIATKLKSNGRLLVALPNVMHYRSRWKLIMGKFQYEESGVWDNTHLRWYTYDSGRQLLERNGYKVTRQWVQGEIPAMTIFKFLPARIRKGLFSGLTAISKGMFAGQLLYEAQPVH